MQDKNRELKCTIKVQKLFMDGIPYNFIRFNIEGLIYATTSTISKLFQNFIPGGKWGSKSDQITSTKLLPKYLTQSEALTRNSPLH